MAHNHNNDGPIPEHPGWDTVNGTHITATDPQPTENDPADPAEQAEQEPADADSALAPA